MEMKSSFRKVGLRMAFITRVTTIVLLLLVYNIPAKDMILIVRREGKYFEDALKGLMGELKNDFDFKDKVINKKTEVAELKKEINSVNPHLTVLMDNSSIALYKKYQAELKAEDKVIPSVSIMGVFISNAIKEIKNACGISYEIPIVTSIVSLRAVLGTSMKKVGIIHREFLDDFINKNKQFCKLEGIEIVNISLPNKSDNYQKLLKDGLKTLFEDKQIDVLWVPNDNVFLKPEIIQGIWIPTVRRENIPVIVGVEVLVKPQLNFGTFAVLPDNISLGIQAAEMIYDIMENDWQCNEGQVDPPLAVYKVINLQQAKKNFNVSYEKLKAVDKTMK